MHIFICFMNIIIHRNSFVNSVIYKIMRNEDILTVIGKNLRAERNRMGLSQEELAEKAGLLRQHISKIESGKIDMRVSSTLIPILKALNLDFEKLFDVHGTGS